MDKITDEGVHGVMNEFSERGDKFILADELNFTGFLTVTY
jgi:hypothetical protein